jgi:hypothetical protein
MRLFPALSYVATSIARLVSLEVSIVDTLCRLSFLAALWGWPLIAVVRMETVVYVALKVAGAMKPRARADEPVPVKPFRAVVASGSTAIRSGVIVTIGAVRGYPDVDTDLSLCFVGGSHETDSSNSS